MSPATRKVPKETPLKGERRLKIGETVAIFNHLYALYAPILRDPLPLENPPLLARRRRAIGGEMLISIMNLTVGVNLNGVAKGAYKQASR